MEDSTPTRRPLDSGEAVTLLVEEFYKLVRQDELLGPIFAEDAYFSWERHIPVMIRFWESALLHTMSYKGNVMAKHIALHRRVPLRAEHFDRWKELFYRTLDRYFQGENVVEARRRVESMAALMQYKIAESEKPGFVQ